MAEAGMGADHMIGRAVDGSGRKTGDALPKDRVGFETDRRTAGSPNRLNTNSGCRRSVHSRRHLPDRHGIHVEHDGPGRMPRVHPVNPLPRQIGRCGEVLVTGRELRLQSSHPAGARGLPGYGAPADNPSHRGIASRAVGVGGDSATVEPELQAAVEIEPKRPVNRFTRRVRHMPRPKMRSRHCFLVTEPTDQSHQLMEPHGKCGLTVLLQTFHAFRDFVR